MKQHIILLIGITLLVVLVGCSPNNNAVSGEPQVFIVSDEPLVFEVSERNPHAWIEQSASRRQELNARRFMIEDEDEQLIFEEQAKLRNVKRVVDGEFIVGYDEELDDPLLVYYHYKAPHDPR